MSIGRFASKHYQMNRMCKIHVWVGTNRKSDEEFNRYFELDYVTNDLDDPKYKVCQFCRDINQKWYDEDFIGVHRHNSDDLDLILDELPVSSEAYQEIRRKCVEKGVLQANALFYYTDAELIISSPLGSYNDLIYIDCFDND